MGFVWVEKLAIDASAVGAAQIGEAVAAAGKLNPGMFIGDKRRVNLDCIVSILLRNRRSCKSWLCTLPIALLTEL